MSVLHNDHMTNQSPINFVWLPGWGANSQLWQTWVNQAFSAYNNIFIDLPGHGKQVMATPSNETEILTQWLAVIVPQLPEKSVIIGWSLGGLLAQAIAISYPQKVLALVLMASSPCFVQRPDWLPALEQSLFERYLTEIATHSRQLLKSFFSLQALGDRQPRQLSKLLLPLIEQVTTSDGIHALQQGLSLLAQLDFRQQLATIQQPCLWLLAEQDAIVPLALVDALVHLQPQSFIYVIRNSSHVPFISQPNATAARIHEFLQQVSL